MKKEKIKVLIVDDSLVFRKILSEKLSKYSTLEIVATASNPYIARDKIIKYRPDVMTLDVEMPRMNGIEFLRKLIPQYPIPTIVISSVSDKVFDTLEVGAVDFIEKPKLNDFQESDGFIMELVKKIEMASLVKINRRRIITKAKEKDKLDGVRVSKKIIAIGASTGGTETIYQIIKMFPKDIPGTVIAQHMPEVFTNMYAERLNKSCLVEVKEAENGDIVYRGRVLIAPGGYHMKVKKKGNNYVVECIKKRSASGYCPSVDILFDSVAENVGKYAIGVILTGMGSDGSKGLLNMRKNGAKTIGQDEKTSVVYGMPKVAYDIGAVEKRLPLNKIYQQIKYYLK